MARYLIQTYTNSGDTVLDNAFGSGTFLVAAVMESRRYIGIEKNKTISLFKKGKVDLFEVTRKRIAEAEGGGNE